MANFSDVAKSAWTTDDGKTTFCVPMASVIHGFIYNKDIFKELGLTEPKTEEEFFAVLEKIKANGTYVPLVLGTNDQWEAATMGFQNIGPNYWKGEEGRKALIDGTGEAHRPGLCRHLRARSPSGRPIWVTATRRRPILTARTSSASARARSMPRVRGTSPPSAAQNVNMGAFKPPVPAGATDCYISDHTDIGIGMNAKTANAADAKVFLDWIGSEEFANILGNELPGFFPLSNAKVDAEGRRGADLRQLARRVQVDDPQLLPDPVARHAQSRERDVERLRPGASMAP